MPRTFTTPIAQNTLTRGAPVSIQLTLMRNTNLSINAAGSRVTAVIGFFDAGGIQLSTQALEVSGAALSPTLATATATYINAVNAALQAAGIYPAGTDTNEVFS